MDVRALRWVPALWFACRLRDFYQEIDWDLFRRVAGRVIAGLIFQNAMHRILSRHDTCQRPDGKVDHKLTAINAHLVIGSKGETFFYTGPIVDDSDHNIGRRGQSQGCGDQVLRARLVGVDVKSLTDAEEQIDVSGFSPDGSGDTGINHVY